MVSYLSTNKPSSYSSSLSYHASSLSLDAATTLFCSSMSDHNYFLSLLDRELMGPALRRCWSWFTFLPIKTEFPAMCLQWFLAALGWVGLFIQNIIFVHCNTSIYFTSFFSPSFLQKLQHLLQGDLWNRILQ